MFGKILSPHGFGISNYPCRSKCDTDTITALVKCLFLADSVTSFDGNGADGRCGYWREVITVCGQCETFLQPLQKYGHGDIHLRRTENVV